MKAVILTTTFILGSFLNSVCGELCMGFYNTYGYWSSGFWCDTLDLPLCCGGCYAKYCCNNPSFQLNQGLCTNYTWSFANPMEWYWYLVIAISLIIFFTSMVLVIVFLRKRQIQRKLKSVKLNASTQQAAAATQSVQISTSGSQPQPQPPMVYSIPPSSMVQTVIYPAPSGGMTVAYSAPAQCPDYESVANNSNSTNEIQKNQLPQA